MASRGMMVDWADPSRIEVAEKPDARFAAELGPWVVSYEGLTMATFHVAEEAEAFVTDTGRRFVAMADYALQNAWAVNRMRHAETRGRDNFLYEVATSDGMTFSQHTTSDEGYDAMNALREARSAWTAFLDARPEPGPAPGR